MKYHCYCLSKFNKNYFFFFICIICPLTVNFTFTDASQKRNKLSIYYETMCPDTRKFILEQLVPTYSQLTYHYLDLELIPYGKVSADGTCQHGHDECYGNRFQGCYFTGLGIDNNNSIIANQSPSIEQQLELVRCMFANESDFRQPYITSKRCLQEQQQQQHQQQLLQYYHYNDSVKELDYESVYRCGNFSTPGNETFNYYGLKTLYLEPKLNFIPWIVMNGVHNDEMQDQSLTNLLDYLCRNYYLPAEEASTTTGWKAPTVCRSGDGSRVVGNDGYINLMIIWLMVAMSIVNMY